MVDRHMVVAEKMSGYKMITTRWTHCLFKGKRDAVGRWIGIWFLLNGLCRSYSNPKKAREKRGVSLFAGISLSPSVFPYLSFHICLSVSDCVYLKSSSTCFSINPEVHLHPDFSDRPSRSLWTIVAPVTCLHRRKDVGGCSVYPLVSWWAIDTMRYVGAECSTMILILNAHELIESARTSHVFLGCRRMTNPAPVYVCIVVGINPGEL